jgi:hypothetical protein
MVAGNAGGGLLTGAVLLVPWLVGLVVMLVLVFLTNPRGTNR